MKKVRYNNIGSWSYDTLRDGEVYDVIRYIPSDINPRYDKIEIKNNIYEMFCFGECFFVDVTVENRNKVIDSILL